MRQKLLPKLSVIVCAFNEEKYISDCIKSLNNQNISKSLYEIIVVDNASTDKTSTVATKLGARVVSEEKKGNVFARIKGVNESLGEIIAFTDADCRVPKNWLNKLLNHFQQDSKLDAVGGVFEFYDGNKILKIIAKASKKSVYHVSGGNMAIKRKSLEKLGGFDPKIIVGEDTVLHFKLKKEGKELIDRDLIVQTSARRFSNNFVRTIFIYFSNDLWLKLFGKALFTEFGDIR